MCPAYHQSLDIPWGSCQMETSLSTSTTTTKTSTQTWYLVSKTRFFGKCYLNQFVNWFFKTRLAYKWRLANSRYQIRARRLFSPAAEGRQSLDLTRWYSQLLLESLSSKLIVKTVVLVTLELHFRESLATKAVRSPAGHSLSLESTTSSMSLLAPAGVDIVSQSGHVHIQSYRDMVFRARGHNSKFRIDAGTILLPSLPSLPYRHRWICGMTIH